MDRNPGHTQAGARQREGVFDRVVERSLFPTWRSSAGEDAWRISNTEQFLTRWVGPPLAPPTSGDAIALPIAAMSYIVSSPREGPFPFLCQGQGSVPIEVKLLVVLYDQVAFKGQVPLARSKPR